MCQACNNPLNDRESTRKYIDREEYIDLCHKCTLDAGILYRENQFLKDNHDDEEYIPSDEELGIE